MGAVFSPRILQHPTAHSHSPSTPLPNLGRLVLSPARSGDHLAIHQLLQEVFRGPSAADFQAQQEEPGYSPASRFVIRDGQRIVGHARVSFRELQLGAQTIPVARVFDLCVLPEFRGEGVATHLLLACEELAREQRAVLLQTRTPRTSLFKKVGWFTCGRHTYSLVGPREVLAEVERLRWEQSLTHQASDDLPQLSQARHPLTVRRWKQTEQAAVQRLYAERTNSLVGPLSRSDEYWRWLIARQAYDWFYVAIDGPDRTLFDDIQGHIVGYMFLKGSRILEMAAPLDNDRARLALLTRACRDAIEQSATPLRLDLPSDHPLLPLVAESGGKSLALDAEGGETFLCKVLDWQKLAATAWKNAPPTERITLQLQARPAILFTPAEAAAETASRWVIERGKLQPDAGNSPPDIVCTHATLGRLLLGHWSHTEAIELKRLEITDGTKRETLEPLFPPRSLWFPPLDDLLAS